jgi:TonB-linked SusC/RagA family outer membrane protein
MKKNLKWRCVSPAIRKTLLIMKLSLILFFAFSLQLSASVLLGQQVSIHTGEASLKSVLEDLKEQTGTYFMYNEKDMDASIQVDLDMQSVSLEETLEEICKQAPFTYEIIEDFVVFTKKAPAKIKEKVKQEKKELKGVVTDKDGNTLPGVSVVVKGTTTGVSTDINGRYAIKFENDKAVLVFSFVGMTPQEITYSGQSVLDIELEVSSKGLHEIIVTGYQTLSVNKSTGSVKVVTAKDIERKGNSNILQSLEGQVAGLGLFTDPTGEGKTKFNIRGTSTLSGSTEPLIVVDGFPLEADISSINPNDVESVTVLKDAASTSIYGSRAANGVIVITTNKGKKGKLNINYRNSFSFTKRPDLAYRLNRVNASDLIDLELLSVKGKWWINSSEESIEKYGRPKYAALSLASEIAAKVKEGRMTQADANVKLDKLRKIDNTAQLEKYFLQNQTEMQHSLSISGGGDRNTFRASLNYVQNKGQFTGSENDKMIFDLVNNYKINKNTNIDVIANVVFNNNKSIPIDQNLVFGKTSIYENFIDENGKYLPVRLGNNNSGNSANSVGGLTGFGGLDPLMIKYREEAGLLDESYVPLQELKEYTSDNKNVSVRLQARLNTKIYKNLSGNFGFQYESANLKNEEFQSAQSFYTRQFINNTTSKDFGGEQSKLNVPYGGRLIATNGKSNSYTLRGQLNFNKIMGDHEISAIAGSEIRQVFSTSTTIDRFGYDRNTLLFQNINKAKLERDMRNTYGTYGRTMGVKFADNFIETTNRFFSVYGNFTYGYKSRYILSGSIRMDQSNLFGTDPEYRYKPFWSLGSKWRVSEEDFFTSELINSLSLRMSYGINGNISNKYGPFNIASTLISRRAGAQSLQIDTPAVPDLRWERTKAFNIGLDIEMFGGGIGLGLDFYNKQTDDLLVINQIDPTLGFETLISNNADINNKGIEVSLNAVNMHTKDFTWTTNLIFRYNKNRVTKAYVTKQQGSFVLAGLLNKEGGAANSFWMLDYQGLNNEGTPMIKNSDGEIIIIDGNYFTDPTVKDLVNAGTIDPIYTASLSNSLNYKNFGLSFMFIANAGHVLFKNSYTGELNGRGEPESFNADLSKAWKKPGDEKHTDIPKIYSVNNFGADLVRYSTKNVISGDYIRLRELIFTYSLPDYLLQNTFIKRVRFNAKATNLFYIAKNKEGIDLEAQGIGVRYFSRKPTFSMGVSLNF